MHFAADRLDRQGRVAQVVVRAMHAALGRRFLVLLDCHLVLSCCDDPPTCATIR
jgi:hypothetical protein